MNEQYRCPEMGCGIRLTPPELDAHLRWDHNRSDTRAAEIVKEAINE